MRGAIAVPSKGESRGWGGLFIGMTVDSAAAVRKGVKQREATGCAHSTRRSRASRGRYRSGGVRRDQLGLWLGTNSRRRGWEPTRPRLIARVSEAMCVPASKAPLRTQATRWSRAAQMFPSGFAHRQALDDRRADSLEGLPREMNSAHGEIRRNQLGRLVLALVPSGSYPGE